MRPTDIRALVGWYCLSKRDLPWRRNPTPYRVWVSEIMLQQTQVRTVLPYYEPFLARFPTVQSLACAEEGEVLRRWAGLGYYRRARNLHRAARKIVCELGGKFPVSFEHVRALPGIGHYTAGAILSIAFDQPYPAIDGNVKRIIARVRGWRSLRAERILREQVTPWMRLERPSDLNQALMELGALLCLPLHPRCALCPIRSACTAQHRGIQDRIPSPKPKRRGERVELVILVVSRKHDVLVCRQSAHSYIPGQWGLPVREVTAGHAHGPVADALAREMLGHAGTRHAESRITHTIGHRRIHARVYTVGVHDGVAGSELNWLSVEEARDHLTSSLFRKAMGRSPSGIRSSPADGQRGGSPGWE